MRAFVLISLGGVAGANARYVLSGWAARHWGTGFPYGTFIINVSGSFVLALAVTYAATLAHAGTDIGLLIGTGFCGSYTTFSTFAFESAALARERNHWPALLNVAGSAAAGIAAAVLGVLLSSLIAGH